MWENIIKTGDVEKEYIVHHMILCYHRDLVIGKKQVYYSKNNNMIKIPENRSHSLKLCCVGFAGL